MDDKLILSHLCQCYVRRLGSLTRENNNGVIDIFSLLIWLADTTVNTVVLETGFATAAVILRGRVHSQSVLLNEQISRMVD